MSRWLWLSAAVAVLDQASKWLAVARLELYQPVALLPLLNLTLMYNEGAAFSFLAHAGGWQRWLFAALAILISLALSLWLARLRQHERLLALGLALIVGGAIGNLIDRVLTGRVIDFIDVYYGAWHWPAFNVADSAISIGVVALLIETLRGGREPGR